MIRIGICDDMPEQAEAFRQTLLTGSYTQQELNISVFQNARELLDSPEVPELIFLDIDMPEMSDIELLQQHGTQFQNSRVIFLTSHDNYVYEGYKYNIFRFLPKHRLDSQLLAEAFEAFERENILNHDIQLPYQGTEISVYLKDIICAEAIGSYCHIATVHSRLRCCMRLKNLIPLLPEEYFYQSHKSYVLNMNYISRIHDSHNYIIMTDGSRVDIASRKKKEFDETHTRFLLRH